MKYNIECPHCLIVFTYDQMLVATHPFKGAIMYGMDSLLYGCPACEGVFEDPSYVTEATTYND